MPRGTSTWQPSTLSDPAITGSWRFLREGAAASSGGRRTVRPPACAPPPPAPPWGAVQPALSRRHGSTLGTFWRRGARPTRRRRTACSHARDRDLLRGMTRWSALRGCFPPHGLRAMARPPARSTAATRVAIHPVQSAPARCGHGRSRRVRNDPRVGRRAQQDARSPSFNDQFGDEEYIEEEEEDDMKEEQMDDVADGGEFSHAPEKPRTMSREAASGARREARDPAHTVCVLVRCPCPCPCSHQARPPKHDAPRLARASVSARFWQIRRGAHEYQGAPGSRARL